MSIEAFHAYCWVSIGIVIGFLIAGFMAMNGPDDPSHP